ncbi:cache domain-containing protein [Gordonia phthalatica]|uniref:cache domain-containing protein n=1 Tax=Gordonia phthalatica TaxID=1136941 RepID=UPI0007802226|nr:cache domain-containing protein [Gordonia phthalatica]
MIQAQPTPPEVAEVARSLAMISDRVQRWVVALGHSLAAHHGTLTAAAIDRIVKPDVDELLADPESAIAGAGFIATENLVSGSKTFMAWWQGPDCERVDALANLSSATAGRYVDADWFRLPMSSGRLHITGPYVDLLCTDAFALTYTAPVTWHRSPDPAGVAGVDVTVATLERRLLRMLTAVAPTAALVNAEDRVIVTAAPLVTPGDFAVDPQHRWDVGHGLAVIA